MDLCRTVLQLMGHVCKIFPPVNLTPPLRRLPLEFCKGVWALKLEIIRLPDRQKYEAACLGLFEVVAVPDVGDLSSFTLPVFQECHR